ncbi:MAG: outer membrane protein assembly factor BamB family protein [Planctomycetota bacterium]|jgi:outer membrane protein assembly factor BamB
MPIATQPSSSFRRGGASGLLAAAVAAAVAIAAGCTDEIAPAPTAAPAEPAAPAGGDGVPPAEAPATGPDGTAATAPGAASAPPVESAGLPDGWPIFRGDRALRGRASGTLPDEPALLWTFETGGSIASSPAVADGRVYVGSDDASVYAIDLVTGEKAWSFATDDVVEAPPLVHAGTVYIGGSDFFFYAIDAATGELKWKHETDDQVLGGANWLTAPDGSATWIVVGCYDNKLYCFDAESGAVQWTYETGNYVNGTPAISGDRIIFGGCDAAVHVVSSAGEPVKQIPLCEECHIPNSLALDGELVFFGHYGNAFVCLDLESGEQLWAYENPRHPFFSAPAVGRDRVVFGGRDKQLHCVRRDDGSPLWAVRTRRKVDGSPVICDGKVVFGSTDGTLMVVSLEDGAELWSYEIGQSLFSSPAVADGMILIGSNDGRLYAFGAPAQRPREVSHVDGRSQSTDP